VFGLLRSGYSRYIGPYVIADSLRHAGYSSAVVNVTGMSYSEVWACVQPLIDVDTLWVGVSTTFAVEGVFGVNTLKRDWAEVVKFTVQVRSLAPKCEFVAGGYFAGVYRRLGWHAFIGHSDENIIAWTRDRSVSTNTNQEFLTRPHSWHLVDNVLQGEALPMEISRGCKFRCAFCRYTLNGRDEGEYTRTRACLAQELRNNYQQWGVTRYTLADDTFNESTAKLKMVRDAVRDSGVDIKFSAYLRLDLLQSHPEQAEILANMGLESAMLGIETLDINNARLVGKGRSAVSQLDYLRELKGSIWADVGLHSGFIIGLPQDRAGHTADQLLELATRDPVLDSISVEALNIIRPTWRNQLEGKMTLSKFDEDSEKYGYLWEDPSSPDWTNSTTGMTRAQAIEDTRRVTRELFNQGHGRIAGFHWNRLINIGISPEELRTSSLLALSRRYDLVAMSKQRLALDRIGKY
jgi:hypothetical protein